MVFGQFKSRVAVMDQEDASFVEWDALISIRYQGDAQITDHPVEGLEDVTDHIRALPVVIDMRAIVSNTPAIAFASLRATPSVPGTDPATRAEAAFLFLEGCKNDGTLLHLVSSLFDYENMAIKSLGCTRDKETSNIIDITLTLRQIQIATTERVAAAAPNVNKQKRGKQVKAPSATPTAERSEGLLQSFFNLFGG
jgi:hypothetical protein